MQYWYTHWVGVGPKSEFRVTLAALLNFHTSNKKEQDRVIKLELTTFFLQYKAMLLIHLFSSLQSFYVSLKGAELAWYMYVPIKCVFQNSDTFAGCNFQMGQPETFKCGAEDFNQVIELMFKYLASYKSAGNNRHFSLQNW